MNYAVCLLLFNIKAKKIPQRFYSEVFFLCLKYTKKAHKANRIYL